MTLIQACCLGSKPIKGICCCEGEAHFRGGGGGGGDGVLENHTNYYTVSGTYTFYFRYSKAYNVGWF